MNAISGNTISIVLSPAGVRAVRSGHPWLYSAGITRQNRDGKSGDIAVLYDSKRKFTGLGLYDADSPIKVRVLHHGGKPVALSREWLLEKISECAERRSEILADGRTTGCRLIHGENDGLAGLVLDRYEDTYVLKTDSACWLPHIKLLTNILKELFTPERIVLRMSRTVKEHSDTEDGAVIYGKKLKAPVTFSENGILFYADPAHGQKTGFFLDQRDNRAKAGALSGGQDVLNVFSYTGGFSLYAAKNGSKSVASLDLSRPALDECEANFKQNGFRCPHRMICGDAFEEMDKLKQKGEKFGLVIVDPPSFARKQQDVPGALKAYEKLNGLAVRLIKKDGVLAAASCSARVSPEDFFSSVIKAVKNSGRRFTELERTGHAHDHPVGFPEGSYLKCIFLRIH